MALTNNNISLIRALADGNIHDAKTFALLSLKEDKTKKNEWATKNLTKKLSCSGLGITEAIPADIKTALIALSGKEFVPEQYYLRDAEKQLYDDILTMSLTAKNLSEMGINYSNTCLLYGPTGTGKTEFAKYLAQKIGKPLFYVNFSQAIDSYLGNTAKNINKIMMFAAQWPCVLLLDEIDCIALKRKESGESANGELMRTTISVMQAMDSMPPNVIMLACTNKIEMLDDALLRRFSIKHEVKDMSTSELDTMIHQYVKATNTEQYVTEEDIAELATSYHNPGQIIPELNRKIGKKYYKANADMLKSDAQKAATAEFTDIWDVTETYTIRVQAESENDAITAAKKAKSDVYYVSNRGKSEWVTKRIEESVN